MATQQVETKEYTADISQTLDLIINTFYKDTDVVVRELVSNANDALEKQRDRMVSSQNVVSHNDFYIRVEADATNNILAISDNGVGMTREELALNLGTIARSGTKRFREMANEANKQTDSIGQFGVGFYSAFLIASTVEVITKSDESDQTYVWRSSVKDGNYTIMPSDEPIERGTIVRLILKEDKKKYLQESTLKTIIKKHSQFLLYPIYLLVEKEVEEKVDNEKTKDEKMEEENEEKEVEDVTDKKEEEKTVKVKRQEWEHLNKVRPIYSRKKEEVTEEEYASFYKEISNDWSEHLAVQHFHFEGDVEFEVLLYVPKRLPYTAFEGSDSKRSNIKLYVQNVLVMDHCEEICPRWLNFVSGVVNSRNLPLNISRETLQKSKVLSLIKKRIVKKALELFSDIANDNEKYKKFYENFSVALKYGINETDKDAREKLMRLMRYYTTRSGEEMASLDQYLERKKEGQNVIYYAYGDTKSEAERTPALELLRSRGIEVILMTEEIDVYVMQSVKEYDNVKFIGVDSEDIELAMSDEQKSEHEEEEKKFAGLFGLIKEVLSKEVETVRVSKRLLESPSCVVATKYGFAPMVEVVLRRQPLKNPMMSFQFESKKIFELNAKSPLVLRLLEMYEADKEDKSLKDVIDLLYKTSLLISGYEVKEKNLFGGRLYRIISMGMGVPMQVPAESQSVAEEQVDSKMEEVD